MGISCQTWAGQPGLDHRRQARPATACGEPFRWHSIPRPDNCGLVARCNYRACRHVAQPRKLVPARLSSGVASLCSARAGCERAMSRHRDRSQPDRESRSCWTLPCCGRARAGAAHQKRRVAGTGPAVAWPVRRGWRQCKAPRSGAVPLGAGAAGYSRACAFCRVAIDLRRSDGLFSAVLLH